MVDLEEQVVEEQVVDAEYSVEEQVVDAEFYCSLAVDGLVSELSLAELDGHLVE